MADVQKGISLAEGLPWMDTGSKWGQLWGEAELKVSPIGVGWSGGGSSAGLSGWKFLWLLVSAFTQRCVTEEAGDRNAQEVL